MQPLIIADKTFTSRLFLGTGKFGSAAQMEEAVLAAASELVTVALKRMELARPDAKQVELGRAGAGCGDTAMEAGAPDTLLAHLQHSHIRLLPNTSGARTASEAVLAAQLGREALETNWVKLEIHPDPRYLMPDPVETLLATETLAKLGFVVLPYIHADPVLCKRLEDAGTAAVMPLGSPIGSNRGLKTADFLQIIIEQSRVPVIIDAGIGAPSDAALAMEMGADAVLVNTAIAVAGNPVRMAEAFRMAVEAGRMAFESRAAFGNGVAFENRTAFERGLAFAAATSPLTQFLHEPV
jgi:thiazole synthase